MACLSAKARLLLGQVVRSRATGDSVCPTGCGVRNPCSHYSNDGGRHWPDCPMSCTCTPFDLDVKGFYGFWWRC